MAFRGTVLSVDALLERALAAPEPAPVSAVGVRHSAADNAARCSELVAAGEDSAESWRFGILQTLDDYTSTLRRGGPQLAARVFEREPQRTGSVDVDAAFAALADFLSERDGWIAPQWAADPTRKARQWFPAVPSIFRAEAQAVSPRAFRRRGIFITSSSLARA